MLAPDLQEYYESSFDMFSTDGWKYLLEDFAKIKDSINDVTLQRTHKIYFSVKVSLTSLT